jgi:aspartate/methionine/tyrosine aminotransferase
MNFTLTSYEKQALVNRINLSDGHARQSPTASQQTILNRLNSIYLQLNSMDQGRVEEEFFHSFFTLAGQKCMSNMANARRSLICHSASSSCEIVANYLRMSKYKVALIEPTFDNIPRILRRLSVPLVAVSEDLLSLEPESIDAFLKSFEFDAIFLVCPNNPSGQVFSEEVFTSIVNYCAVNKKLVIIDFAFRLFSYLNQWDQYETLDSIGVDYLIIEDTGKAWSIYDMKVGILTPSKTIFDAIADIHDDYLLNVSPFILKLITEFILDSSQVGLSTSVRATVDSNRNRLREDLADTTLVSENTLDINVEWLKIDSDAFTGEDLYKALCTQGVHILPGTNFYWLNPKLGQKHIRVALARDIDSFLQGIQAIRRVVIEMCV